MIFRPRSDMAAVSIRCGERPSNARVRQACSGISHDRRRGCRKLREPDLSCGPRSHDRGPLRRQKKLCHQLLFFRHLHHACIARATFYFEPRWCVQSLCKVAMLAFRTATLSCRFGIVRRPARAPTLARSETSARLKS